MLEHVYQMGPPMQASTCCVTIHWPPPKTPGDGWGALGFVMQQHYAANVECEMYVCLSVHGRRGVMLVALHLHVSCMHERDLWSVCWLGWDGCNFVCCVSETITACKVSQRQVTEVKNTSGGCGDSLQNLQPANVNVCWMYAEVSVWSWECNPRKGKNNNNGRDGGFEWLWRRHTADPVPLSSLAVPLTHSNSASLHLLPSLWFTFRGVRGWETYLKEALQFSRYAWIDWMFTINQFLINWSSEM